MVATTGTKLLPSEAVGELRTKLLPLTTVLTPNIPEARLLLADAGYGHLAIESVRDLEIIARTVHSLGPRWVLIKGGHCPFRKDGSVAKSDGEKDIVVDILFGGTEVVKIETPYQNSRHTHGTGCSLACEMSIPQV
jgi:hydroxymethylpyrimidine/phosphomethylpyrimidine kinase